MKKLTSPVGRSGDTDTAVQRLSREAAALPAPPVRAIHVGLGNFHRAHQAWYLHRANLQSAEPWGIAAFTGRRPDIADALRPQGGLYVLVTRSPGADSAELVSSISAVHESGDTAAWLSYFTDPLVRVVTLTITEVGYCRDAATGRLDARSEAIVHDIAALRDGTGSLRTAPGRLVQGLAARRTAGAGGMAIVSCDNLPGNGTVTASVITALAALVDPVLATWIETHVSFPSTMVDRITPRVTPEDVESAVALTGWDDRSPVVTEPYSEWVVEHAFPAGTPPWQAGGATFVEDVTPFEQRKLLMLNGAHSLLAYTGLLFGHATIAEAVADRRCRARVETWWDEVAPLLAFDSSDLIAYRRGLLERFGNVRIRHLLEQVAEDGSQKVVLRVGAVVRYYRSRGVLSTGAVALVGAWIAFVRSAAVVRDADVDLVGRLRGELGAAVVAALEYIAPEFARDSVLIDSICTQVGLFERSL